MQKWEVNNALLQLQLVTRCRSAIGRCARCLRETITHRNDQVDAAGRTYLCLAVRRRGFADAGRNRRTTKFPGCAYAKEKEDVSTCCLHSGRDAHRWPGARADGRIQLGVFWRRLIGDDGLGQRFHYRFRWWHVRHVGTAGKARPRGPNTVLRRRCHRRVDDRRVHDRRLNVGRLEQWWEFVGRFRVSVSARPDVPATAQRSRPSGQSRSDVRVQCRPGWVIRALSELSAFLRGDSIRKFGCHSIARKPSPLSACRLKLAPASACLGPRRPALT